jgi:putative Holliday junction resolvase
VSRVIGLDPGTVRIGVAVSDSTRAIAFPRESIDAGDGAVGHITRVIAEEGASLVVIGRAIGLSGSETASSSSADLLRDELAGSVDGVEFVMFDERLSTVDARRRLADAGLSQRQQRRLIDSQAAVVILQSYLDATPA